MKYEINIPKGTRDFTPEQVIKRQYIFNVLEKTFTKYGYLPIETPAMEKLNILLGKYGEEGDKLIFKILNSGNFLEDVNDELLNKNNYSELADNICEKGLRYDLTVPFARYIVMHRNEIMFPFKRYQMQPVWRADKPQKGRYREFYQCDIDVIGSKSLLNEVEIIQISDEVFSKLDIPVVILINHRDILFGLAKEFALENKFTEFTTIIDKLEKLSKEKIKEYLAEITPEYEKIIEIFEHNEEKSNTYKISYLKNNFSNNYINKGIEDIEFILKIINQLELKSEVKFELSLARGLSYYTGVIFEIKSVDYNIGSICGGGRYDNLTEVFGLPDVSGVGISFGADRIYDVMEATQKFPMNIYSPFKVLIMCIGKDFIQYSLNIARKLRNENLITEVYPEFDVKLRKQMSYANFKKFKFVLIIGEDEYKTNKITLKDMSSGNQQTISIENVIEILNNYERL